LGKQKRERWFLKQGRHERKWDSGRKWHKKFFLKVSDWLKLLEGKSFFPLGCLFVCLNFFVLILCTKMSTFLILLIKSKRYGKMK